LQGELVDRIEHHVTNSSDWVETAREKLQIAETYQTKARKVKWNQDFRF
jgi:t-SNARE complex subunit (syntaxin)